MAVLGVADHRILGMPDGALAGPRRAGLAAIDALLDEVEPDTILTFGPDGITFHPDHIAVSPVGDRSVAAARMSRPAAVRRIHRRTLRPYAELYETWGIYMTDERPVGVVPDDLAVDVRLDGWQLDRKTTALAAMTSQTGDAIALLGAEAYAELVAEETFVDASLVSPKPARSVAASPRS